MDQIPGRPPSRANCIFLGSESDILEVNICGISAPNQNDKAGWFQAHGNICAIFNKKAAKLVHHCPVEYNIVPSMQGEIEFFARYLKPDSGVKWEAPIAYLIERTPFALAFVDACLESGGGYSIDLKLWYFVRFPKDVVRRTLKYLKDNKDKNLISINVLKFVIVIINYCAAWTVVVEGRVTDDPHPVLLNAMDNTSAHS